MAYIEFKDVKKKYQTGSVDLYALQGADFFLEKGELTVILGQSGAGKTTLLNILGGMDKLSSGNVYLDGKEISALKNRELAQYRRYDVGFVFQFYNLIPNLTAYENIEMASQLVKNPLDPEKLLRDVGLEERRNNFPSQLSGGEQQRISIARAIAKNPKLLLCDEPTGALDYVTGKTILKLLSDMCREKKMTVIVITHNQAIAPMADKVIYIKNGKVENTQTNKEPVPIEKIEW